ncbi:MAG: hypothetical protein UV80_C0002G0096 [Candidatus Peregrinibacteria bacterium GW2011_GWF2_43_17]|nr:MAG: hypothetical protein UV80_C0002G0096 [Candidatus Peregrinibacteria bacterium GW2011_GWF2_43_17]KKT18552.1 MAG: hypothetical protein UW03_C0038G0003 [Candidatus Peregrinibacteria bacterium GW2011_GWA2_43_8]HAU39859.1 hypothetical protein [Candidatus Peregrinibacteria bacterium]
MKKILLAVITISLLSGCQFEYNFLSSTMDENEYLNTYIDYLNPLADNLDYAFNDYLYYVPEAVTVDDEIFFYGSYYGTVVADLEQAKTDLLSENMDIADDTKEGAIEYAAKTYLAGYETFLTSYKEAADYYSSSEYKNDVSYAATLDETIINNYYDTIGSQAALFDLISGAQKEARGELNEDSTDPVEKIGVSLTLLSDLAEEASDTLSYWDFTNPDVTGLEDIYNSLVSKHAEEEQEVSAIYSSDYDSLFSAFETGYLGTLTSYEAGVKNIIDDSKAGLVTGENSADYDYVFVYYDELIDAHNSIVDLLEMYY